MKKEKPAADKAADPHSGGGTPKRAWRTHAPAVSEDRLNEMIAAAIRHHWKDRFHEGEAMSTEAAREIAETLILVRDGTPKPSKIALDTLRRAVIARELVVLYKCPQDEALLAAFDLPMNHHSGVETLQRNYRNWLKVIGSLPFQSWRMVSSKRAADFLEEDIELAYRKTTHHAKRAKAERKKGE